MLKRIIKVAIYLINARLIVISEKISNPFKTLECCNTLPYDDFVFENRRPLKGLKGRAASYIASLNQKDDKDALEQCYTTTEKVSAQ